MADKMVKLSYEAMMEKFIPPVADEPDAVLFRNIFDPVSDQLEVDIFQRLVESLNKHVAGDDWQFVIFTARDPPPRTIEIEMNPRSSATALGKRSSWSTIELYIACSAEEGLDPFKDDPSTDTLPQCDEVQYTDFVSGTSNPPSSERTTAQTFLDQIIEHTDIVFQRQQRTHYYTLAIFGRYARMARWDRSGCIYSDRFDFVAEPAKLALLLWRLSHATTPDVRGHDTSATRVLWGSAEYHAMVRSAKLVADDHARELFAKSLVDTWPWWKLTVSSGDLKQAPHEYLVAKPTFAAPDVVGRGTRGYVALDYTDPKNPGPFVYLKDCWRIVHPRSEQEGAILAYLNGTGVRHIPTMLCHGDIGEKTDMVRDIWKDVNGVEKECPLKNHRHYRLVVKEVGKPLKTFKNGRALVWVVLNAVMAHMDAYTLAHTIHQDLSVGNILIMPAPEDTIFGCYGLLTDWELSKRTDDEESEARHPDRTGTWQFMSVNALQQPRKQIDIPDEMESVFHILLYCSVRYLPHSCGNVGEFMRRYFDDGVPVDDNPKEFTSGPLKTAVVSRGVLRTHEHKPIVFLLERPPPANVPSPPSNASPLSANPSSSSSSSPADPPSSPSPSRATTPVPPSSEPKTPLVPQKEYTRDQRHPMDHILRQMLPLFEGLYSLQDRTRDQVKEGSKKKLKTIHESQELEIHAKFKNRFLQKAPRAADREHLPRSPPDAAMLKVLEENARKLREHTEIGRILTEAAFQKEIWPEKDKINDQLLPTYNADVEDPQKAKLTKRSAVDTFEACEHKKARGAVSQT
ncbi:uncharacterized protein TRAVEDRAFT_74503 [Trametes versicolor FP-101664 SS1]|uniref:uncharacterized protein n=1 Tax=Trametes versicolor (strain FP-101664) TaxID=717944 RepID=UPI0004621BA7|nr:uncharacterized protein TRAVEDRAFT_74503 [Trametes versicolor FP-101664 SS1]EIW54441.1 hypothetical protein TRAVEDRAFT_74503 [Trametes versicolor FP-101664 SS1]